jgi:DNA-binding NtrC family response regulator
MEPSSNPQHVLVVDDEPLMCWSLAEMLTQLGDIVTQARTGAAAVRALREAREPIDVALLDYKLPDVDDLSLLQTVRRLSPTTRVVMMSAHFTPEAAREALALGAARVVNKPIDILDVPSLVHGAAQSTA